MLLEKFSVDECVQPSIRADGKTAHDLRLSSFLQIHMTSGHSLIHSGSVLSPQHHVGITGIGIDKADTELVPVGLRF